MPNNRERTEIFEYYKENGFLFRKLEFEGLSNKDFLESHPSRKKEEIPLFSSDVSNGDEYLFRLDERIKNAIDNRTPFPVVRFYDGEYWYYSYSLKCNGLYEQAESRRHIKMSMPMHVEALKYVSENGHICPLIYKENFFPRRLRFKDFIRGNNKRGGSGSDLLYLMSKNNMFLTDDNYTPFHVIYAYLSSKLFLKRIKDRKICIVNTLINEDKVESWFKERDASPSLSYVKIPEEYVATQWKSYREEIINAIPDDVDLCLVGAGIGALMICADISSERHCPSIDAGHILNFMNGRTANLVRQRLYLEWD